MSLTAPPLEIVSTLTALVEKSLADNAQRTALVFEGAQLSYHDLDRASRSAVAQLVEAGVRRGDRVALLIANGLEFPAYDVALLRLGAVKVPLNDMLAAGDVAYCLGHSGARALVVSPGLADLAAAALGEMDAPPAELPALPAAELVAGTPDPTGPAAPEPVEPGDAAALFYTGGTTGRPKGVLHLQRGMALNQISTIIEAEIGRDERLLLTTPMPHAAGLLTMAGLLRGAQVVIARRFDADEVLGAIEAHGITWTFMVPTMIYRVLDAAAARDAPAGTGTLRTVLYGAAPIDPGRLTEALDRFGPAFIQLYGQTECPNFATTLSKGDHERARSRPDLLLSCGRPVLMAQVSIRDEEGAELAAGEIGEVCIRSPYTMEGYFGDEEAGRARFFGSWLRTGDIGAIEADGYLYLKDRRSDMVISGGMNVYTAVVERAVASVPGVAQCAVIGIPDADWGEAVHAVVTAAPGQDAAVVKANVMEHCRPLLARYMRPKSVEVVDSLPLTAYGKLDKKALRARHWADRPRQI